jgi:uncharacterized membrane protein SirB2
MPLAQYYFPLRALHVAAVAVSIGLFVFRAGLRFAGAPLLQSRFLRIAPHVVDSVLLASAVLLTLIVHQYPFVDSWLTAKVFGLVAYVVLGSIAIRNGRTPAIRAAALVASLLVVGYIVGTALHHDADPRHW